MRNNNKITELFKNTELSTADVVYESPDQGETVYARISGSTNRTKINESDRVRQMRQDIQETQLWHNIREAAKNNTALQEAIDRVILLYQLSKQ